MNTVNLIGRLCRDVEVKELKDTLLGTITLAVDRANSEDANFIRCKAFGQTVEFLEKWTKKGQRIGVTGHLQSGQYEKDGNTVFVLDVIIDHVDFADGKSDAGDGKERGRSRARR